MEPILNILDANTFDYQVYDTSDEQLITSNNLDTSFTASTDYIEYYVYDQNNSIIFPSTTVPLLDYDVRDGDILLTPIENLENLGYDLGTYRINYTFYRKRLSSSPSETYFISEISSDRTEIRLDSNIIEDNLIVSSSNEFILQRANSEYFVDFYLNFGSNQTIIANNIELDFNEGVDPTVLIKLYEPLPPNFDIKDSLWVVEELSAPQLYEVVFPFEPVIPDDFTYIKGPNYSLNITQETGASGESFSYNTLLNSNVTSSINQIKSLLNEKEININIDYEKYSEFVNFSSAKTRLENFYYKVGLIESASNAMSGFLAQVTSQTTNTTAFSASLATLSNEIDTIIKNFDGYEYFLYFNSGSLHSWPKSNSEPPFSLFGTGSSEVLNWIGSADPNSVYYGGQALSASNYDQNNRDRLFFSIPEYLREDPANKRYELFVDMVGQYYDNVWVYTKDITNKFDADNRLEYGISKDLVADAIKDFAVKLYSSNFNTNDLFTAFLGLTPSGSSFPFPNITGSVISSSGGLDIPTGYEFIDSKISASNDIVPLNDVQKQVYKRIYHNIPYLLKTKGTVAGIRALITAYGIPDTILRINEFGGKDRNEAQDYDLEQNVFNYALDTGPSATGHLTSSFVANTDFIDGGGLDQRAGTIQLRFKSAGIPIASNNTASSNIRYSQSIWMGDNNTEPMLVLEYTGSGFVSGSHSGSVPSPYDTWGTLKWIPEPFDNPQCSSSIFLPFFNKDWWSVQINAPVTASTSAPVFTLQAANEINGKVGFASSSITADGYDSSFYQTMTKAKLNTGSNMTLNDGTVYQPFSGAFQELRYYSSSLSQSKFFDYTVNPYSDEGNNINSTPNTLFFRADLGTQLDTGSRISIHPRVTGSLVQITQSFNNSTSSSFFVTGSFVTNVEKIYQDQVPAGIKNRITDKIILRSSSVAEAPYGYDTTGIYANVATQSISQSSTLSAIRSVQPYSFTSQSYTPNVNYLEVAFSPSDQINDDINAQIGYFNLGDYIGDPRLIPSSSYNYPDLDRLRNAYFEKYINGYDVKDFIRLIKFFDNSLFKMIQDFTPARTSLASGVVVKQHLLERNRLRPAQLSSSFEDLSGSIKPFPKDYNTGSSDFPQYSTSGSALYKFTGGPGGVMNRFNGLQSYEKTIFRLKGGTNFSSSVTTYTISGLSTDSYDGFNATVNGFYGTQEVEIGEFSGTLTAGVLDPFSISVQPINAEKIAVKAGDTITFRGALIDGTGLGTMVITLQESDITSSVLESPNNKFYLTQSYDVIGTARDPYDYSIINGLYFNYSSSQFLSASYQGIGIQTVSSQHEFYDGEFSGSDVVVTTQSLNPDCGPYLNVVDIGALYDPVFFNGIISDLALGTVDQTEFDNSNNEPPTGFAFIYSRQLTAAETTANQLPAETNSTGFSNYVTSIKLARIDKNGNDIGDYIVDTDTIEIFLPDANTQSQTGGVTFDILGVIVDPNSVRLNVSLGTADNRYFSDGVTNYFPITSSKNGGSEPWFFNISGSYRSPSGSLGSVSEVAISNDLNQQGVFRNESTLTQRQFFVFYGNEGGTDPTNFNANLTSSVATLNLINPNMFVYGSASRLGLGLGTNDLFLANGMINNPFLSTLGGNEFGQDFAITNGSFVLNRIPNIPLNFQLSVNYSASILSSAGVDQAVTSSGLYHSGSGYNRSVSENTSQLINFGNTTTATLFFDGPFNTLSDAASDTTPGGSLFQVFYSTAGPSGTFLNFNQSIFSDKNLTTLVSIDTDRFYNAYRSDPVGASPNYSKQGIGKVDNSLSYQFSAIYNAAGNAPSIGISGSLEDEILSGLFIPPTLNETVDNVTFFDTINTKIPGNSGSEAVLGNQLSVPGGHPKIRIPGTASLTYDFGKIELSSSLAPQVDAGYVPISSSFLTGSNQSWISPSQTTGDNVNNFWTLPIASGQTFTRVGAYEITSANFDKWKSRYGSYLVNDLGYSGGNSGTTPPYVNDVDINYFVVAINASFRGVCSEDLTTNDLKATASIQVKASSAGSGEWTDITDAYPGGSNARAFGSVQSTVNSYTGNLTGNGKAVLFNDIEALATLIDPTALSYDLESDGVVFRIAIRANADFFLSVTNWSVYYVTVGGNWTPTSTLGTQEQFGVGNEKVTSAGIGSNANMTTGGALTTNNIDVFPTSITGSFKMQAHLKYTGSINDGTLTPPTVDIILTSSELKTVGIDDGVVVNFSDDFGNGSGEFTNILPYNSTTNASSSLNLSGGMYYFEYSMSQFSPDIVGGQDLVDFNQPAGDKQKILISQSYDAVASGVTNPVTSMSLELYKGNISNVVPNSISSFGSIAQFNEDFTDPLSASIVIDFTSASQFTFTGSYYGGSNGWGTGDMLRMAMSVDKANTNIGVDILSYTMSFMPAYSYYTQFFDPNSTGSGGGDPYDPNQSLINLNYQEPTQSQFGLPTFFNGVLPFQFASDCQPLLNNYNDNRPSTYIMDVDYNNESGPIIPVNQTQILENVAVKAAVPDSNYETAGWIVPRYTGSRSNCKRTNVFTFGDTGTLGQLPNVEERFAYFAYFESLVNPYPMYNGVTQANVAYLVDEQENALPPALSGLSFEIMNALYPAESSIYLSVNSSSKVADELNGFQSIKNVGEFYYPVCYTQNSGQSATGSIPLSGSGRVSAYDNDGTDTAANFIGFSAMGEGLGSTMAAANQNVTSFDITLAPYDSVVTQSANNQDADSEKVYASSRPVALGDQGVITMTGSVGDGISYGEPLKNPQTIFLETKVGTTFLFESGTDEMEIDLYAQITGSDANGDIDLTNVRNIPIQMEDVTLDVYYLGQKVYCGSVLGQLNNGGGWRSGELVQFAGVKKQQGRRVDGVSGYTTYLTSLSTDNKFKMLFENPPFNELLLQKGVYWKKNGGVQRGGPVEWCEWTFKINTGDFIFKKGDRVRFRLEGRMRRVDGNTPNAFYPSSWSGTKVFPTMINLLGTYDSSAGDNTATGPFWRPTGSSGKLLEMQSVNFNEAYGSAWSQGNIPYTSSGTKYYPGGGEPAGTKFPKIKVPLQLQVNDQIRFVNDENYSYKIVNVIGPESSINSKLTIELNKEVPSIANTTSGGGVGNTSSIDLDFFLIRRPVEDASIAYIDLPFPYSDDILPPTGSDGGATPLTASLSASNYSSAGLILPEFPSEGIQESSSIIINNLISKGVIQS